MSAFHAQPASMEGPGDHRTIRVLLVDDHTIVRAGLAALLDGEPGLKIVGEAGDGEAAVRLTRELRPDVVLMDITMPVMNGIEATRRIAAGGWGAKVIGLSMHDASDMERPMRDAGALAYLPKDGPADDLVAAIREAAGEGGE